MKPFCSLLSSAAVLTAVYAAALPQPRPGPPTNASCQPIVGEAGAAFALTNSAADNQVIAFSRESSGALTMSGAFSTGGRGIGVDFDTQGGLRLSEDNRYLYAVNPGSDTVTVFSVDGSCLSPVQEVYAGDQPLSITLHQDRKLAYVLDGSVASTGIFGFTIADDGTLGPILNETIPLSTPIGVPGVVAFSPNGNSLVVANKVGSTVDLFTIGENGEATLQTTTASEGLRPFAAVFRSDGTLFVVESGFPVLENTAVSSYSVDTSSGALSAITRSEKNQQSDGCWITFAGDNEDFLYVANFVSGTVSGYSVAEDGSATLLDPEAGFSGNTSEPVDLVVAGGGQYLYNLLRGTGAVAAWTIREDGGLDSLGVFGEGQSLPAASGVSGLAAF